MFFSLKINTELYYSILLNCAETGHNFLQIKILLALPIDYRTYFFTPLLPPFYATLFTSKLTSTIMNHFGNTPNKIQPLTFTGSNYSSFIISMETVLGMQKLMPAFRDLKLKGADPATPGSKPETYDSETWKARMKTHADKHDEIVSWFTYYSGEAHATRIRNVICIVNSIIINHHELTWKTSP